LKYHPDKNQGNEEANKKFAEINNGIFIIPLVDFVFMIWCDISISVGFLMVFVAAFVCYYWQRMKCCRIGRRGAFMTGMGRRV